MSGIRSKKKAAPDAEPRPRPGVRSLVARRILAERDWERLGPTELARLVAADPFLAARAMTAANLPLYGLSRRVATLSHAIAVLGPGAVRRLAETASAREDAEPRGAAAWAEALATAALALRLAEAARYDLPEEAHVAALLLSAVTTVSDTVVTPALRDVVRLGAALDDPASAITIRAKLPERSLELAAIVALARARRRGADSPLPHPIAEALDAETLERADADAADSLGAVARWLGVETDAGTEGAPLDRWTRALAGAAARDAAERAPEEAAPRRAPDLSFLHKTIRRIREIEGTEGILDAVLAAAHESLDCDRFVLFELSLSGERRSKTLVCRKILDDGSAPPRPSTLKLAAAQRGASIDAALRDGTARRVTRRDPADADVLDLFGCDEIGVVPLVHGGKPAGAIVVDRFYRGGAIPDDALTALEILCAEASLLLENRSLSKQSRKLKRFAEKDELTGINNRRYCAELCRKEVDRARRYRTPLSLVMFDIDNFKELNDRFGHGAGDAVLREVARWIERNTRRSDVIGRYGGDEFIVCLPAIPADQALVYAERMRAQVERLTVDAVPGAPPVHLRISLGVGSLDVDTESFDELLAKVDKALYAAKQHGRNRVCVG